MLLLMMMMRQSMSVYFFGDGAEGAVREVATTANTVSVQQQHWTQASTPAGRRTVQRSLSFDGHRPLMIVSCSPL